MLMRTVSFALNAISSFLHLHSHLQFMSVNIRSLWPFTVTIFLVPPLSISSAINGGRPLEHVCCSILLPASGRETAANYKTFHMSLHSILLDDMMTPTTSFQVYKSLILTREPIPVSNRLILLALFSWLKRKSFTRRITGFRGTKKTCIC